MFKRLFAIFVVYVQLLGLAVSVSAQERNKTENQIKPAPATAQNSVLREEREDDDPDLPSGVKIDKDAYRRQRNEHLAMLRGFPYPRPEVRNEAIYELMRQENALRAATGEVDGNPDAVWTNIGPAPIPNGQTTGRTDPVSGRVSSIAVHPTNPNIAYVGAAQGGVYRTLDGGATWTPILDNALSLAIGAIAISPSDPTIVFVGTGEAGFSADSFFGVGVYRITNADTSPVVAGPLNTGTGGTDVFTGRSISEIIVHPTNPNTIFVSSTRGTCGLGGCTGQPTPAAGVFRATNALAANPTFAKLNVTAANGNNREVMDMVIEPDNPNNLVCWVVGNAGVGDAGVYRSTNALDASPTFTQTYVGTVNGARGELSLQKSGTTVTVVAATGDTGTVSGTQGKVIKSVDGGATFSQNLTVYDGFCNPQCFYDIAVAFDPTNANNLYVAGSPALVFGRSTNGGTSSVSSATGLHVDSHAIAVAPSNPSVIYFGSDGGVWKSLDAGVSWTSQNNSGLSTMQYQSISLHPTDRFFSIGGTQDNGTHFLRPNNSWVRATGGDGGQSAIDQNATDVTNVNGYHTFFNSTNTQIGYQRISIFNPTGTTQPGTFRGCTGTGTAFGINCTDPVLFYSPLTRGPGNPNTIYLGTNKVYRSANRGDNHDVVSQAFAVRVSAIGIAPNDDNIRLAGLTNGQVFVSTTAGATTMTDITGSIPARYITRFAIDPTNNNVAYVAIASYGLPAGQHVFKTTNLLSGAPTWTASGTGIPDVPTNALALDPANSNIIYAGTDIGVYRSSDGGANWLPYNDGLPRVAVFDMAVQQANRIIRIATHGRGIYEASLNPPTSVRSRADFDGDGKSDFSVFRTGNWFVQRSLGGFQGAQWGATGDQILPGDYDNDNKTDYAVYRSTATGGTNFFVVRSSDSTFRGANWGTTGDIARGGDFDGDGVDDLAVYRPSNNTFFALPTGGGAPIIQQLGQAGDIPLTLKYDADSRTDFAVFRPSTGTWFIRQSTNGQLVGIQFGASGDQLVPADYDNDNRDDIAVFRNGLWVVLRSSNGQVQSFAFGQAGDVAAPGDFDGDGADDFTVYRNGTWFVQRSTQGFTSAAFGIAGDIPIPTGYLP